MKIRFCRVLTGICIVMTIPFSVFGETRLQDVPSPKGVLPQLDAFLSFHVAKPEEKRIQTVLKEAFSQDLKNKKLTHLKEKRIFLVSPREAGLNAIRKNLFIHVSAAELEIAKAAVMEAEAVFDPVLSLSYSFTHSESYNRSKFVNLLTRGFFPGPPISIPTIPDKEDPQIIEIGWKNQTQGLQVSRQIYASRARNQESPVTHNANVSIAQQLPWGPELRLGAGILRHETFYDQEGHSYDAPYSSSIFIELLVPLPLTKNFGPYAEKDVTLSLSKKNDDRSHWAVKSIINVILLHVDRAFWNLVRDFEALHVAIEKRKLAETQLRRFQKRFEDRMATIYDKLQLEAELAGARVVETVAKNAVLSSSYALAVLIEDKPSELETTLYFPYDYYDALMQMDRFDGDDIMASALAQRPELQVGRVELEQAKILERFSRNQRRPDMTFSAGGRFSQNNSVHGYKTIEASLKHLGRPDSNYRIYALDYSYPVGNRALKAKEAQSRTNVQDVELSLSAVENQIRREIKDALSDIRASMARIQASTEAVAFAQLAYDKLEIRRDIGEINEFEWTLNLRRLMDAKLSQLSARIDLKKGLSRLRAAKGTIAHYYVAAVSENRFDRLRIGALEANGALLFLGTGAANDLEERQK